MFKVLFVVRNKVRLWQKLLVGRPLVAKVFRGFPLMSAMELQRDALRVLASTFFTPLQSELCWLKMGRQLYIE